MKIRNYLPEDKDACLKIFKSNQPMYFADHELKLFTRWLDHRTEKDFFVIEVKHKVVGCGGIYADKKNQISALTWGMILSTHQRKGYGTKLTGYRVATAIKKWPTLVQKVNTSQHTHEFYKRFGYVMTGIKPNYWGRGLHRYEMEIPSASL